MEDQKKIEVKKPKWWQVVITIALNSLAYVAGENEVIGQILEILKNL